VSRSRRSPRPFPSRPLGRGRRRHAAVEAEERKKPDRFVEVFDDKTDVDEVGDAGPMLSIEVKRLARHRRLPES
jgi:hypothetical protein